MSRLFTRTLAVSLTLWVSSVIGANIEVQVGNGGLTFNPPSIKAQVGDTITYKFFPKNHAVVQSTFAEPCKPQVGAFFSGFVPTQDLNTAARTTFTITVNDTKPIWFYCPQTNGDHCQAGMVGAINAPDSGDKTFDAFKALALKAAKPSTAPGKLPIGGLRKLAVDVGANGLTFTPNNITEIGRTVVEFTFNPKNHTVTQSSFADPCHPLAGGAGFFSGFVPTSKKPSGVTFQVTVNEDEKPVWFYCSQTAGNHCQSGMVGSINAAVSGPNTLAEFIFGASKATGSTAPAVGPVGGVLSIGGKPVNSAGGSVIDTSSDTGATAPVSGIPPATAPGIPPATVSGNPPANPNPAPVEPPVVPALPAPPAPSATVSPEIANMAGGAQPSAYGWAPSVSQNATDLLQLINWVDNALIDLLVNGHIDITSGKWGGMYPPTIQNTVGSMGAQSVVHRYTSTDSLTHYGKKVVDACKYKFPQNNIADFVKASLTILLLEIGLILDTIGTIVTTDVWMVAPLASTLGSKARMAGLINMMQNHIPAAAPREVALPANMVYSYISNNYVVPGSCTDKLPFNVLPVLPVTRGPVTAGRLASVTVTYDAKITTGLNMAWLGAWGKVWYSSVTPESGKPGSGSATVPAELSGHVWGVLVNGTDKSAHDLESIAIAGPEMVWVTEPSAT